MILFLLSGLFLSGYVNSLILSCFTLESLTGMILEAWITDCRRHLHSLYASRNVCFLSQIHKEGPCVLPILILHHWCLSTSAYYPQAETSSAIFDYVWYLPSRTIFLLSNYWLRPALWLQLSISPWQKPALRLWMLGSFCHRYSHLAQAWMASLPPKSLVVHTCYIVCSSDWILSTVWTGCCFSSWIVGGWRWLCRSIWNQVHR